MNEEIINHLAREIRDIKTHLDYNTRIHRYNLWKSVVEENIKSNRNLLSRFGYRVYSQNDQDGIINKIFEIIGIEYNTFIEFGCDNGIENNTHYLLLKDWKGLWIDSNIGHINFIHENFKKYLDNDKLSVMNTIITKNNINNILSTYCMHDNYECDLLVIDTDWNDYWFWKEISIKPRVLCIEYNSSIRPGVSVTVPYSEKYCWDGTNCFGASLDALTKLSFEKYYILIGCSLAGTDAFFLRRDIFFDLYKKIKLFRNEHSDCLNFNLLDYINNENQFLNTSIIDNYEPPRYCLEFNLGHNSSAGNWEYV